MSRYRFVRWLESPAVPLALVWSVPTRVDMLVGRRSEMREVRQAHDGWRFWESARVPEHSKPVNYSGQPVPEELAGDLDAALMSWRRDRRREADRA